MASRFLLPESVARADGDGAVIALEAARGKVLLLTLGITRIVESESLDVSVWGSPEAKAEPKSERLWRLLESFPPKYYCGTYAMRLDLRRHPEIGYLRAMWRIARWAERSRQREPLCGFYLFAEELVFETAGAA